MRRRMLTLGSTEVYLHLATALFAAYVLLAGAWRTALAGFLSILLHEGAHALTATLLGQPPQEIELSPMGAVMRLITCKSTTLKKICPLVMPST